jgi:hypothetical protein
MTAVDIDRRTSDMAALLRHQEAGEIGEFPSLDYAADRDLVFVGLVVLLDRHVGTFCQLHMLVGADKADEHMALTGTLCGANSCDSALVIAMPAARDIEVGMLLGRGALAPMLRTLMMRKPARTPP